MDISTAWPKSHIHTWIYPWISISTASLEIMPEILDFSFLLIITGWGESGKVILQVSIAVFSGTDKKFFGQRWLSPLEKNWQYIHSTFKLYYAYIVHFCKCCHYSSNKNIIAVYQLCDDMARNGSKYVSTKQYNSCHKILLTTSILKYYNSE